VHSMHENVRLCVERNRHSWSCPVKRLRSSGAERARAAISGAPAEPSGLERQCRAPQWSRAASNSETSAGAVSSSSQAEQFRAPWRSRASSSEFEQPFRAPWRSRVSSSGHFERPSRAERARSRKRRQVQCFLAARPSNFERPGRVERVRAAISSAPAEPSGLERPFRAPQRSRAGLERLFRAPQRSRAGSSGPFRAPQPSRAGPSGHFERPSGAERARSRKRRQGRCSRGRPSRVKPRTACGASKPP